MAKSQAFIDRLNAATDDAERHKLIENNTPVCEDNPSEMFNHIYRIDESPWDYDKPFYDVLWGEVHKLLAEKFNGKTVVDLGCGRGQVWDYMRRDLIVPGKLIGYDVADVAVQSCRDLNLPGTEFHVADLGEEGFTIPDCDMLFTVSALYYIPAVLRYKLFKKMCDSNANYIFTCSTRWAKNDLLHVFPEKYGEGKWELLTQIRVPLVELKVAYHGYLWQRRL